MTQPPYRLSDGHPMRRFALFVTALTIVVVIGVSQPRHSGSSDKSICVCVPSRAGLLLKSAIAMTQAGPSELLTQ